MLTFAKPLYISLEDTSEAIRMNGARHTPCGRSLGLSFLTSKPEASHADNLGANKELNTELHRGEN